MTDVDSGPTGMEYDYLRLRVKEFEEISYTYDARGNLLDRRDAVNAENSQYVHGDGIDDVVLLRGFGENLYALITDHLGSVVAVADNTGRLVVAYDYTPFGKTTIRQQPYGWTVTNSVVGNVLGSTGREMDGSSGLYYYRNRWYSPELGRFLEPDSIGLAGWDVNLYRYVWNSASGLVDPLGLLGWRTWAGVAILAGLAAATVLTGGLAGGIAAGPLVGASISGTWGAFTGGQSGFLNGVIGGAITGGFTAGVGGYLGASVGGGLGSTVTTGLNMLTAPCSPSHPGLQLGTVAVLGALSGLGGSGLTTLRGLASPCKVLASEILRQCFQHLPTHSSTKI